MPDPISPPDDAPEVCGNCDGPLPAEQAAWWLSGGGVYCSQPCADEGAAAARRRLRPPPGEYACCVHCEHREGEFDHHTVDPPPHPNPCAEGCNDDD